MFKVNYKNTRTTSPMLQFVYNKVTGFGSVTLLKRDSNASDVVLVFLWLTLNIFPTIFYCFYE